MLPMKRQGLSASSATTAAPAAAGISAGAAAPNLAKAVLCDVSRRGFGGSSCIKGIGTMRW